MLEIVSKRVAIFSVLFIWSIKLFIRPYWQQKDFFKFFWGIAPNLIGCFVLPFGIYLAMRYLRFTISFLKINVLTGLALVLVFINEAIQLIPFFGRTFDWFDLLFSIVGLLIGYSMFYRQFQKQALQISSIP